MEGVVRGRASKGECRGRRCAVLHDELASIKQRSLIRWSFLPRLSALRQRQTFAAKPARL